MFANYILHWEVRDQPQCYNHLVGKWSYHYSAMFCWEAFVPGIHAEATFTCFNQLNIVVDK